MSTYTVHQAKTNLSKFIAAVEAGEKVVIARGTTPVVRLVSVKSPPKRVFGVLRGQFKLTDAFFEPLPEDELAAWEGAYEADLASEETTTTGNATGNYQS